MSLLQWETCCSVQGLLLCSFLSLALLSSLSALLILGGPIDLDGESPGLPTPPNPTGRVACQMEPRWDQAQDFLLLLMIASSRPTQHSNCEGSILSTNQRLSAFSVVSMPHFQHYTNGFQHEPTAWPFTACSVGASQLLCFLPLSFCCLFDFFITLVLLGLRGVVRFGFSLRSVFVVPYSLGSACSPRR